MLGSAFAKLLPLVVSFVLAQECPEIPDNDIIIGEPVPLHPEDIPQGCSKYEILVGKPDCRIRHLFIQSLTFV